MEKRIEFIDELRGVAILIMIGFHILYQSNLWLNLGNTLIDLPIINVLKFIAQVIFISVSGVCSELSKNNYKRGIICIYLGIFITVITWIFIPNEIISFGILHLLGCSIIVYEILREKLSKYNNITLIAVLGISFIIFYVNYRYGLLEKYTKNIWIMNFLKDKGMFNFMGIRAEDFYSSDYFPILPWIFLFFMGGIIGKMLKKYNNVGLKIEFKILRVLGRHSLIIYLFHIPIILIMIYIVHIWLKI